MQPIVPQPGQESVWDYPRPPRVEPTPKHLQVIFNGVILADSRAAYRVLETSHPPVYYIPLEAIQQQYLLPSPRTTYCEWKGHGSYYTIAVGDRQVSNAAWYYAQPTPEFEVLRHHVAFYAAPMDRCLVDGEVVTPQPGNFYGGWITQDIVGPFKGEPGSWGW